MNLKRPGLIFLLFLLFFNTALKNVSGCGFTPPNADFVASTTSECVGQTITFTDTSDPNDANITGWNWDFGSGATPATANSKGPHNVTYTTTGQKTVSLTVYWDGGNNNETKTHFITINALPATPSGINANPATICPGTSSTISVTNPGSGYTTDWYTGSCGGTIVPNGSSVNSLTVTPSITTTYYARTRNTTTGCVSTACLNVTVNVNPAPPAPTGIAANPGEICIGSSSIISVNNPGTGYTTDWYTGSCGGTIVPNGSNVNSLTVTPSITTTYYARTRNTTTNCVSTCQSITVTVGNIPATPSGITANPAAICIGASSIISVTNLGGNLTTDWFIGSCGGTAVPGGTGVNSITVSPGIPTTYYARTRNTATGCISNCVNITVTVNPIPATPSGITASPASICSGNTSTISVTNPGTGFTTDWFTGSCGGTAVPGGTGVNSLTVNPAITTTYYARTRNTSTNCVSTNCQSVTINVSVTPAPSGIIANPTAICSGASSTISVNNPGSGFTTDWYTGSCGGTAVPGGTGANSLTVNPAVTTIYFARTRNTSNNCVSTTCQSVTVTVNTLPGTPTGIAATPATICSGSSSTISVNNPGAGLTTDWYTESCGGTPLPGGTGDNSLPVSPTSTTTYYARTRIISSGCLSTACQSVTVTVNTAPPAPTGLNANPATICNGSSSTISVNDPGTGYTTDWYTGSCGGTAVPGGMGTNSISVTPANTTTYYARTRSTSNGCYSSCQTVTITVDPRPGNPTGINASQGTICLGSSSTISVNNPGANRTTDWFTGSCGGTPVPGGYGVNSLPVSPTTTTTYYARTRNTATGCVSNGCQNVTVNVTIIPEPTGITANPATLCGGGSSTLSVNNPGWPLITDWYTGSCGGTLVRQNDNSWSVSPATTTTYYARTRNYYTGCVSFCQSVTVTVGAAPAAPTGISASQTTLCSGASSTLSVNDPGSGYTTDWYTGSCGGTAVPGGTSVNSLTVSPSSTTRYYARTRNTSTSCVSTTCQNITITVNALPTSPTGINATPAAICNGASSLISVNNPGAGFTTDWFTGSCGGTPVPGGSGVNSLSVYPSSTTTYFARKRLISSGCYSNACQSITVTVTAPPLPAGITANPSTICGATTSTISVTDPGPGNTTDWYTGSCGGTLVSGGSGVNSLVVSPVTTTTYYAQTRNISTGCVTPCQNVTVTVGSATAAPTGINASSTTLCSGASATISVNDPGSGNTTDWYTVSCGGTAVPGGIGVNIISVSPATTTTYYARTRNTASGCVSSSCQSLTITVNPSPSVPTGITANPATICAGSISTISVNNPGTGYTTDWYTGSCGGSAVTGGTGVNSMTVNPSVTTTYYARTRDTSTGCVSNCQSVTITVGATPASPTGISANPATICIGASSTVSVNDPGSGYTTDWYTGSCGGTPVPGGSGVNSLVVTPAATMIFYARTRSTSTGCVSNCQSVTVIVEALPSSPTGIAVNPVTICIGASSTISVTNPGPGFTTDWFTGSCGGSAVSGGSGVNSLSVSPAITTTYYARTRNTATGCYSNSCQSVVVTVTVPPAPSGITAYPAGICIGASSVISVNSPGAGYTTDWYTEGCSGSIVSGGSGINSLTVNPITTTTYYARTRNTSMGCVSTTCQNITVIVNSPPAAFTVTGGGINCHNGVGVPIGLSGSETGVNYRLYLGGVPIGSPIYGTGSAITFGNQPSAGTYTIVATRSANSCSRNMDGSVTVTLYPSLTAESQIAIGCTGNNDEQIIVTAIGGTAPYQFSIDNGLSYTSGTNPNPYTFSGLSTNVQYKIRVKDINGCESPVIH